MGGAGLLMAALEYMYINFRDFFYDEEFLRSLSIGGRGTGIVPDGVMFKSERF